MALLALLVLSPDVMGFSLSPAGARRGRGTRVGQRSSVNAVSMAGDPIYDRSVSRDCRPHVCGGVRVLCVFLYVFNFVGHTRRLLEKHRADAMVGCVSACCVFNRSLVKTLVNFLHI